MLVRIPPSPQETNPDIEYLHLLLIVVNACRNKTRNFLAKRFATPLDAEKYFFPGVPRVEEVTTDLATISIQQDERLDDVTEAFQRIALKSGVITELCVCCELYV